MVPYPVESDLSGAYSNLPFPVLSRPPDKAGTLLEVLLLEQQVGRMAASSNLFMKVLL